MDISDTDFEEEGEVGSEAGIESPMDTTGATKSAPSKQLRKKVEVSRTSKPKTKHKRVFVPFEENREKITKLADLKSLKTFSSLWYFGQGEIKHLLTTGLRKAQSNSC